MCKRCQDRGQTWNGDKPICALSGDNWNCATINAVRDICDDIESGRVDYQYCDDQKYATLKIDECEMPNGAPIGLALWVTWYKNRGRTDGLWILSDGAPPRAPTMEELEIIIGSFANNQLRNGDGIAAPKPDNATKP